MCMTFHEYFVLYLFFIQKPQSANLASTKQQFKFHANTKSLTVANELIILPSLSICFMFSYVMKTDYYIYEAHAPKEEFFLFVSVCTLPAQAIAI